jgi:hypothetical protein
VLVASADKLDDPVRAAIAGGADIDRMTQAARALVEESFDWWKIGDGLHEAIAARNLL